MPSESMVKRVARGLSAKRGDDFDSLPADKAEWVQNHGYFSGRYRGVDEPTKTDYLDDARAAIAAMWEPTNAMMLKGHDAWDGHPDGPTAKGGDDVYDAWTSMIDAALNEEEGRYDDD